MNKKINELNEKDKGKLVALVKNVTNGVSNKGAPYLTVTLQDDSGMIDGKVWDVKDDVEKKIVVGYVLSFQTEVIKYNHGLQLKITGVETLDQSTVDISNYVVSSQYTQDELKVNIKGFIDSLMNENYKKILLALWDKWEEEITTYPAASKNHHSFFGGLATHITSMVHLAESICVLYPQCNRDLLVSGVIVHDLGKVIELSGPLATEYTLEGKLIGHISIMHGMLMVVSKQLQLEDTEEALLLRHLVLSHHGGLEYGSPVLPQVLEAEVLSFIDNLDARLNTLEMALQSVKPGEFTSRIFAMENRIFYRPKY